MNPPEITEVERLIRPDQLHDANQVKIAECDPLDSADSDHELDPLMMDRPPSRRSKVDADRLLSILDELERRSHE